MLAQLAIRAAKTKEQKGNTGGGRKTLFALSHADCIRN